MNDASGRVALHAPTASSDSEGKRIRPAGRQAIAGSELKKQWLVQLDAGEEHVEADEVEILPSGVLVFYRFQSRLENERTLLVAWSPTSWRQCRLESDG